MSSALLDQKNALVIEGVRPSVDAPVSVVAIVDESQPDDSQIEVELRQALDRDEFRVVFEPILSLNTHRIMGFEALLRWQSPRRGLLSPGAFLRVAEESGLIVPIGHWVLQRACLHTLAWQLRYPQTPPLVISVNLSARQFEQPDLVEQVGRVLGETGLAAESLRLEITETLVARSPETARSMLLQLRALDVKLGIDDFGAGYCSLGYVRKFPVHTLKIDRSFIGALEHQKENLEIVRAIITMARNLGLDVVAEGIETAGQLALLKLLQCDYGQGHFLSKPLDAQDAGALIALALDGHFDRLIPRSSSEGVARASNSPTPPGQTAPSALPSPAMSAAPHGPHAEAPSDAAGVRPRFARWKAVVLAGLLLAGALFALVALSGRGDSSQGSISPGRSDHDITAQAPGVDLLSEIRTAMSAGRYAFPADNNSVFYCNQVLANDPRNDAVLRLKDQSIRSALAQAEERGRAGDAAAARQIYLSLQPLLQDDDQFGVGLRAVQQGLKDIEFSTYTVAHDHFLDSCQGKLRFNAFTISFTPVDGSTHGFTAPINRAAAVMDERFLKIVVADKTYRFKAAEAAHGAQGKPDLAVVQQEITRRRRGA